MVTSAAKRAGALADRIAAIDKLLESKKLASIEAEIRALRELLLQAAQRIPAEPVELSSSDVERTVDVPVVTASDTDDERKGFEDCPLSNETISWLRARSIKSAAKLLLENFTPAGAKGAEPPVDVWNDLVRFLKGSENKLWKDEVEK
jgi:hypothetical protein